MPNPQIENGHLDVANEIVEALMTTQLSGYQSRVIWAIWRKTWAWHKKEDWISVSQLVQMTRLYKSHISRTVKELIERGIVTKNGNKISFNKIYTQWKELPKLVTNKIVTKNGNGVTKIGHKVTKIGGHKRNYTKETYTKENILSKDNTKTKVFGNPDINSIISHLKEKMGIPMLDGSQQSNRNFANLLLKKFGGLDKCLELINIASENKFWANKITSVQQLYYKGVSIISETRDNKFAVKVL